MDNYKALISPDINWFSKRLTLMPLWALTGGRAGAAGHVPPRAGSCRD